MKKAMARGILCAGVKVTVLMADRPGDLPRRRPRPSKDLHIYAAGRCRAAHFDRDGGPAGRRDMEVVDVCRAAESSTTPAAEPPQRCGPSMLLR